MNGESGEGREPDVVEAVDDEVVTSEDISDQTVVIETDDDDVSVLDSTAEIRVDELVAKLDKGDGDSERKRKIKKRLEELEEKIGDNLDGTYNIDLDDV